MALEEYTRRGRVVLATENDDAAGYILANARLRWRPELRPIFQAAVAMDAQRRHIGLSLLRSIENDARAAGQIGLQANCRVGVEANEFWHAAGFIPIAHLTPDTCRKRDVICWRKLLVPRAPLWFIELPKRAGFRAAAVVSTRHQDRRSADVEFAKRFITSRPNRPPRAA